MVTIKSKKEIEIMKEACKVVALTHKAIEENIKPGMTTWELDQIVEKTMKSLGAISAEKNYPSGYSDVPNFPASACISINDEVIHGIPSKKRIIKEGDIVSIDLVALKNGFHGDAARTIIVGKASKEAERLVQVTKQAFFELEKYSLPFISNNIVSKYFLLISLPSESYNLTRSPTFLFSYCLLSPSFQ